MDNNYELIYHYFNFNNAFLTRTIRLKINGKETDPQEISDSNPTAIFKMIEKITETQINIKQYSVKIIPEKNLIEAIIETQEGIIGKGLSTDTVDSLLSAYIEMLNKMFGEEELIDINETSA